MNLKKIQDADLEGKKVLLRLDLDTPVEEGEIIDDSRLESSLETLNLLLTKAQKIIIIGHLGRPEGKDEKFSLKPIAEWFSKHFETELKEINVGDFDAFEIGDKIILLENLRFYKEEEDPSTSSGQEFSKKLSSLADIYVNDAFAVSHRPHASIVGIPKFIPSFAGLRLQKEVEELSKILENPDRPLTIIIGGAKIETKLPLVEKMHFFADYVLVGGEIAEHVRELAKVAHDKLENKKSILLVADLTSDNEDISEVSIQNFIQVINNSKTIVWNGPMGEFEKGFDKGTKEIAKAVANSNAYTIVGGGETIEFCKKEGLLDKFSFVSTGGGAMLEFLSGSKLPGLEAISV
ncbi:MAG: hypothetical protein A3B38_03475 [Candidatus Levybacteria bacterium RIFCSPLOWO2_01_FULL_36_13]|nr:MAG: hypothetical protein A2684_00410 [Candidatus Levybacteria bacterium RIFCSPHIGHO2_01_FULL_36_15b]OGH34348.1 MAG: hypothetical protein A3B38_03475 [Candidatus Levybacteria bacterium RIFCSPLOWO2_01_FULL_36_13]